VLGDKDKRGQREIAGAHTHISGKVPEAGAT
jgi:hypothetical protein